MAGILLTMLVLLVVIRDLFPDYVDLYLVPVAFFTIFLWLNGYRMSQKQKELKS